MSATSQPTEETRALGLGTLGNAVGAVSAMVFYLRSGSDALMLDGLYTAVMAGASVIAARVSRAALQPRSRAFPFGASGQEPLYVLFRTLVLLGIIRRRQAAREGQPQPPSIDHRLMIRGLAQGLPVGGGEPRAPATRGLAGLATGLAALASLAASGTAETAPHRLRGLVGRLSGLRGTQAHQGAAGRNGAGLAGHG